MSTSLKVRRLERRVNEGVKRITHEEQLIAEAINKDLLERYSDAIKKAERVSRLMGAAHMDEMEKVSQGLVDELRADLKQATNFRDGKTIRNRMRNWLGGLYKGGVLKQFATFLEELKFGFENVQQYLSAAIDEKSNASIRDQAVRRMSEKDAANLIINAFEFSNAEWNGALDSVARGALKLNFEQLEQISEELREIGGQINKDLAAAQDAAQEPTSQEAVTSTEVPATKEPEDLATQLAQLEPDEVDRIVRSANRRRRRLQRAA